MRTRKEMEELYAKFEKLISDCRRFRKLMPGERAQQFSLGAAAMLYWALGNEPRPLMELLEWLDVPQPFQQEN